MRAISFLALVLVLGWWYLFEQPIPNETIIIVVERPAPVEIAPPGVDPVTIEGERETWAYDLVTALGNENPTWDTIQYVVAWTEAEDRSDNAFQRFNPLNTTYTDDTVTQVVNSDGVKGYATYEDGLNATVATITGGNAGYDEILAGLQTNDPIRAWNGLVASPWGTDADAVATIYNERLELLPTIPGPAQTPSTTATGSKSRVTDTMEVNAGFYATGSPAWASQGGMHYGVDYAGGWGTPVYLPFDCTFVMVGEYTDAGRRGQYFICHLLDGSEYYSGHLENVASYESGALIPAGTQIGQTNDLNHTHVQLRTPDGQLADFEEYYNTH